MQDFQYGGSDLELWTFGMLVVTFGIDNVLSVMKLSRPVLSEKWKRVSRTNEQQTNKLAWSQYLLVEVTNNNDCSVIISDVDDEATEWATRVHAVWNVCIIQSADNFGRLIPWLLYIQVYTGWEWTLLTCCWLPLVLPRTTAISSLSTVAMMFGVCAHEYHSFLIEVFKQNICE